MHWRVLKMLKSFYMQTKWIVSVEVEQLIFTSTAALQYI